MQLTKFFSRGLLPGVRRDGKAVIDSNYLSTGPTTYTTAGAQTYTAADLLTGTIIRDCAGASRTDVMPTAALLQTELTNRGSPPRVGDRVTCYIVNGSDPITEILTLNVGTGGSFIAAQDVASRIIGGGASKLVTLRFTAVGASAAYQLYF